MPELKPDYQIRELSFYSSEELSELYQAVNDHHVAAVMLDNRKICDAMAIWEVRILDAHKEARKREQDLPY